MYFQTRTKIDINRCIFIVKEVFYTPNKVRHGEHEYFGLPPPSNGTALLIISSLQGVTCIPETTLCTE